MASRPGPRGLTGEEARGVRPGERDRRLAEQGWVRRFVAAPPRLEEWRALYETLGHEVRLERPGEEELAEACAGCGLALELFRVLYTREGPR